MKEHSTAKPSLRRYLAEIGRKHLEGKAHSLTQLSVPYGQSANMTVRHSLLCPILSILWVRIFRINMATAASSSLCFLTQLLWRLCWQKYYRWHDVPIFRFQTSAFLKCKDDWNNFCILQHVLIRHVLNIPGNTARRVASLVSHR